MLIADGTSVKAEERRLSSAASRMDNDGYRKSYFTVLYIFSAILVLAVVSLYIATLLYLLYTVLVEWGNFLLPYIILH